MPLINEHFYEFVSFFFSWLKRWCLLWLSFSAGGSYIGMGGGGGITGPCAE